MKDFIREYGPIAVMIVVSVFLIWGGWTVSRKINFSLSYKDQVQKMIHEHELRYHSVTNK